ncbi:hypothetical protein WA1_07400 [Scytonema hofmannii PCC 7110]|uniref:Sulfatase-modifying factor enzyme-like domain-containing protein n=1 Tax=Scytonema hofmannii PCC 7110 TaxID=128403 RepID=A0A139WT64_9CYAN|nr:SUMF1/EgtB/PvdO family nonheme iron enzyme [Scytonema hofmannii]KYC35634.1 hypothetical protein WA1_07400 [Scytonema hofmannii PCC 7110]
MSLDDTWEQQRAQQMVERFVSRFQPSYKRLAYYAALPLLLTPELLNFLRIQFLRSDNVPWVAEVDLLLSDLCSQVGYELYAMDTAVRAYLLKEMKQELGEKPMQDVARVLISYVRHLNKTNPFISSQELQVQRWAAMAYLDDKRQEVVSEIFQEFQNVLEMDHSGASLRLVNGSELARILQITQELSPQLSAYPNLIDYASIISGIIAKSATVASQELEQHLIALNSITQLQTGDIIALKADNGKYLNLATSNSYQNLNTIEVEKDVLDRECYFKLIFLQNKRIALMANNDKYWSNLENPIIATHNSIESTSLFIVTFLDNGKICLKTENGKYLSRINYGGVSGYNQIEAVKDSLDIFCEFEVIKIALQEISQSQETQPQETGFLLPPLQPFVFDVATVEVVKPSGRRKKPQIKIARHPGQAQFFTEYLPDSVTLEMVSIPGGSFLMGSPETEEERSEREGPQHEVTLQPFFMGKYPITQAQWRAIAALPQVNRELDPDPSGFKGGDRPVENVSWYDAVEFCDRLSIHTKRNYQLPSEAEWEYACRAGTTTPFHFGETITPELANYDGNYSYGSAPKGKYRKQTTPIGSFQVANAFGLFDMHGNVWEWCADIKHDNYEGAPSNSTSWQLTVDNDNRMLRGGSWIYNPRNCRSAFRSDGHPDYRYDNAGFRVVLSGARTL